MAYKHYKIACNHPDEAEAAMNVFLASHSVLKAEGKLARRLGMRGGAEAHPEWKCSCDFNEIVDLFGCHFL